MTENNFEALDREVEKINQGYPCKISKVKQYEPYIIAAIAAGFIIIGFIAASFLNAPSGITGFVVADLTNSSNLEYREIQHTDQSNIPLIMGSAAIDYGNNADILTKIVYGIAFLSLMIAITYALTVWWKDKTPSTWWLVVAYWLAMAGVPISVYCGVTRNSHPIGAYAVLGAAFVFLSVIVMVKPWANNSMPELRGINRLLDRNKFGLMETIGRIKQKRRKRRMKEIFSLKEMNGKTKGG